MHAPDRSAASAWLLASVFAMLAAACGGGSDTGPGVDAGPPAGWTCDPHEYGDGLVCHCACGIADPDCARPELIVSNCELGQLCTLEGTCTSCGNGSVDDGEACDPALSATAACAPLGYAEGQVPCNASCQWAYDQCQPLETCANGMLDPGELCDGTSVKPGLDCADYGRTSGSLACLTGCAIDSTGCYTCGDGKVEASEGCDDHDTSGNDGCSASCTIEPGWDCTGEPSLCTPHCGDGNIVGNEQCDDGDGASDDGCSATCRIEQDCQCSGEPSTCTCASVQVVATPPEGVDTAALVLDDAGKPRVVYVYAVDFQDPATNISREHAHLIYAERAGTTWANSEVQTWDQLRTVMEPIDLVLGFDGGTAQVFFHRVYNPDGTFAVATRTGTTWQFAYDSPYYPRGAVRGNGAWHALVSASQFDNDRYRVGAPNAWTIDESFPDALGRLARAPTGDAYVASFASGANQASFKMKLVRRTGPSQWATEYEVTTTAPAGGCVVPFSHEPLALPNGGAVAFEEGFDKTGRRWLRAHRKVGASWVVEDVADLSWLASSCTAFGSTSTSVHEVTAVDNLGRPHILYPSQPQTSSLMIEDHYRDGTGWHVRTFPLTRARPLAMVIDAAGTTHLVATAAGPNNTTRLVYLRIDDSAW